MQDDVRNNIKKGIRSGAVVKLSKFEVVYPTVTISFTPIRHVACLRLSPFACFVNTVNRKNICMGSGVEREMRYAPRSERAVNFWLRLQPVNVLNAS
jgi:hypothetical protein